MAKGSGSSRKQKAANIDIVTASLFAIFYISVLYPSWRDGRDVLLAARRQRWRGAGKPGLLRDPIPPVASAAIRPTLAAFAAALGDTSGAGSLVA